MRPVTGPRRGFALVIAIGSIVVIGALIAGVYYATTQEYRIGRNSLLQTRAMTAAEFGLNAILAPGMWNDTLRGLAEGSVYTRAFAVGDGSRDTVRVTRLSPQSYHVVSEGSAGRARGAQARRRVGMLLTLNAPVIQINGALTTRGQLRVGGSSYINGVDSSYAGWGCPSAGAPSPGVITADDSQITTSGCSSLSCINGSPKVQEDAAAGDTATYFSFGPLNWSDLAGMATHRIASGTTMTGIGPTTVGGVCNTSYVKNWGDPDKSGGGTECDNHYPIIYAEGDLSLSGGSGQGILLVNGDLSVQGGFQFFGPVIVRGTLKTTGQGGHFNGGVMAANVDLDQSTVLGDAVVQFSRCALQKAILGSALPAPAARRPWVDLF